MSAKTNISTLKKGMMMSIAAQVLSLTVSFILNLIVPKVVDGHQYAYWQTFMLYASYVGILHFGMLDGIVLHYSQYDYDQLDKPRMRSEFMVLLVVDAALALIMMGIGAAVCGGVSLKILILVAIGIVTRNLFTYTSYTFQITNRINRYATLVVAQRAFYGIGILTVLALGGRSFIWLCLVDLSSDLFAVFMGACFNRGLYFGSLLPLREIWNETKSNISAGVLLLIANWASNLILGAAKMMVQWHWDDLVFGKVSFSFSVSNLFMNVVTALSVVLFPSLKRMPQEELPGLYKGIRALMSPVLFLAMVFYFPGCWVLRMWLPRYTESLTYLGIFLPVIVFSAKVNLLTNNYLKAYRREGMMFGINLASIAVALVIYGGCLYFNHLEALLLSIVGVMMLRSILSELAVMRTIGAQGTREFFTEAVMTVIFILSARIPSLALGGACYASAVALYIFLYREAVKGLFIRQKGGNDK